MADQRNISDSINYRETPVKVAVLPSALAIQNIGGTLCQVDDEGNVTPLIGGTIGGITAITGDVVATGPGVVSSVIQPGRVTYAKIQNVSDAVLLGNNSGGAASVQELTKGQVISFLGLAAIATSGSAADLTSGTLPAGRFPAITGDVTIGPAALSSVVNIPATRIPFGDGSGHMTTSTSLTFDATGNAEKLLLSTHGNGIPGGYNEMLRLTNTDTGSPFSHNTITSYNVSNGGAIALTSAIEMGGEFRITTFTGSALFSIRGAGFGDPLQSGTPFFQVFTTEGDVVVGNASITTTATTGFLIVAGSAGPPTGVPGRATFGTPTTIDTTNRRAYFYIGGAWHYSPIDDGASSGITQLVGDAQAGPGTGIQTLTIQNNVVTLAKMATMATNSLLGRSTAGTGNVEVITVGSGLTLTGGTLTSTSSGGTITALTGDVTASGSGSVAATIAALAVTTGKIAASAVTTAKIAAANITTALIANNAVTYALIQTQADQTILGNVSGGVASPSALTKSQVLALLNSSLATGIVGDTATSGALNSSALTNTDVLFATGANTIGQDSQFTYNSTTHVLSASTVTAGLVQGGAGNILTLRSESGAAVSLALNSITTAAELKGPLVPTTTDTYSLGSTSLRWAQMYVTTVNGNDGAGLLNLKSESTGTVELTLSAGSTAVVVTGDVIPHTTLTYDLGTTAALWSNVYAQTVSGNGGSFLQLNSDAGLNPDSSISLTNGGLTMRGFAVDLIFQAVSTTVFRVDNANKRIKFSLGLNTPTGLAANVLYTSWAPPTGATEVTARKWLEVLDDTGELCYIQIWQPTS